MNTLRGIIHNGKVILTQSSDLPDGTEVEVVPVGAACAEADTPPTKEEIGQNLAAMDAVEPFELTEEERKAILADHDARRKWEKNHFYVHAKQLRENWE